MKLKGGQGTRGSTEPIYFATSNKSKFAEAEAIIKEYGIALRRINLKGEEIQHTSLKVIALRALTGILTKISRRVIVEDSGLFISRLKGFPGAFSSYVLRTIGNEGILRLLEGADRREAVFHSAVAYGSRNHRPRVFRARVAGEISLEIRGSQGFGFDPIFIPRGSDKTFAEMLSYEKNRISHRSRAFTKFAKWYRLYRKGQ